MGQQDYETTRLQVIFKTCGLVDFKTCRLYSKGYRLTGLAGLAVYILKKRKKREKKRREERKEEKKKKEKERILYNV